MSLALLLAAAVFLVAALAGASLPTALGRALIAWLVFAAIGLVGAALVRWVLRPPQEA